MSTSPFNRKIMIQEIINWLKSLFKKSHILPPSTGGTVNYAPNINYPLANWIPYMSLPYRTQWEQTWDEDNCATRAAIEVLEAILNYYLKNNLFSQPIVDFLNKNGFINSLGWVKLSIRYSATTNNTTSNGVSVDTVFDNFNICGVVPESWYPDPPTPFSWNTYYAPVPQNIIELGEQLPKLIKVDWTVIVNDDWQTPNIPLLQQHLQNCPIYFASNYGSIVNGIEQPNTTYLKYEHARVLCTVDNYLEVLDSYVQDYNDKMSLSCPLACCIACKIEIL